MKLKRALVGTLASVGLIVILLAVAGAVVGFFLWPKPEPIPKQIVLEIDFEKGLEEYAPTESVASLFSEKELSIKDTVFAIKKAAQDDRVLGLVARVGSTPIALATVQEMREALLAFRSKKKPAIAYSETFGEFGPGNNAYYLATAFDKVYLQPSGDIGLTGLMYQTPFIKGALEKLGISPKLSRRGEYKTAVNTFTEDRYTEAQKESLTAVMQSNFKQILDGISEARGLSTDKVQKLFDQGPFLSSEALNANLVDGLLYRDEVYARIKRETGGKGKLISLKDYWEEIEDQGAEGPIVALIYGVGSIHLGKSKASRIFGGVSMGSDTITKAFRQAAKDKRVKAILFRIDSPGGSYVASDTIWRQVMLTQKAGKPVVASMGDVAASGGYFVAMAANKIVAQPSTLTGSIGVFAGKPVTTDFWKKLGVTWDEVHTSDHSAMWSTTQDYTPQEWDILQKWLDHVYQDFTTKVAKSRKLPLEKVQEVAQGRVWTGQTAKSLGLVDELGGFPDALALVKQLAKIPESTEVRLETFPRKKTFIELIADKFFGEGDDDPSMSEESVELLVSAATSLRLLRQIAATAGLLPGSNALLAPQVGRVSTP